MKNELFYALTESPPTDAVKEKPAVIIISQKDQYYANIVIRNIIKEDSCRIPLIVLSDILYYKKSSLQSLKFYIRKSGISYTGAMIEKQLILSFLCRMHRVFPKLTGDSFESFEKAAKGKGIEILHENDLEKPAFIDKIRKHSPDYILSVYSRQIFRKPLLQTPRMHCINIHPSILPKDRGVSPIFWAMSRGENLVGATLHTMQESVDTGTILAQTKLEVKEDDTEHGLYYKLSVISSAMINNFFRNDEEFIKNSQEMGSGCNYNSIPTREAFLKLKKNNRRLFTIRQL
ncbi:MAG: formyltransferase family protein, partial [bacterium]